MWRLVRWPTCGRVGLLDAGFTDGLEHSTSGPELARPLKRVGLVTLSGGRSYVTDRTFNALLAGVRRPLWVSAYVLRTVSYALITKVRGRFHAVLYESRP